MGFSLKKAVSSVAKVTGTKSLFEAMAVPTSSNIKGAVNDPALQLGAVVGSGIYAGQSLGAIVKNGLPQAKSLLQSMRAAPMGTYTADQKAAVKAEVQKLKKKERGKSGTGSDGGGISVGWLLAGMALFIGFIFLVRK